MTNGMAENDLVRFVLQSKSLDYPILLPFMPRHELNAECIMGEVQRVLQSNENVNLQDGMQVHLVHVGMPQGGVSSRKRKHYGFQLSNFLDTKQCVIRIRNKDLLCLACALVTVMVAKRNIPNGILSIKDVSDKPSRPKSCIIRQVSLRVFAVFQRRASFGALMKITRLLSSPPITLMP